MFYAWPLIFKGGIFVKRYSIKVIKKSKEYSETKEILENLKIEYVEDSGIINPETERYISFNATNTQFNNFKKSLSHKLNHIITYFQAD